MFGRERPAFRSPSKILEDLANLDEQGVEAVFLFQDPRMGGPEYWREFVAALRSDKSNIETLALELVEPATPEYLESLASLGERVTLTISPESGVDGIRKEHGRAYTNQQILSTASLCRKLGLSLTVFFMVGLAGENSEAMKQTEYLWEQLYTRSDAGVVQSSATPIVKHGVGPMILLDPGSLAFDYPEKFGYRLFFKSLRDYIAGMMMPSWHQWMSYETRELSRKDIVNMTLLALEESIRVREKYGVYMKNPEQAAMEYFIARVGKVIIDEVDKAMGLGDVADRLGVLAGTLLDHPWESDKTDPYGFRLAIRTALLGSVGLLDAA
jgi:hypothetical protein